MRKIFSVLAASAALSLLAASPAQGADYDAAINLNGMRIVAADTIDQAGLSAAVVVGSVGTNGLVSSELTQAGIVGSIENTTVQNAAGTLNGALNVNGMTMRLNGAVTQVGASIAGSGAIGNGAEVASSVVQAGAVGSIVNTTRPSN